MIKQVVLALGMLLLGISISSAQPYTQCVASASVGGTPNAITIPALPCGLTTNLLILSASGANTSTAPTLQPIGLPAQIIVRQDGSPLVAGDISGAGYRALLNATGQEWVLLNPANASGIASLTSGSTLVDGAGNQNLLYNNNGTLGDESQSAALDGAFGGTQGEILYRGVSTWGALAPGASGDCLETLGTGFNPQWSNACGGGGGSGTGNFQDFISTTAGGSDFTPGTSLTLTLTNTPLPTSNTNIQVYFDGVLQSKNTWSYASPTVSFNEAILAQSVVEVDWGAPGSGVLAVGLALPTSVFGVSGSPVTSAGTLTGTLISQAQNSFFAGPGSGGAGVPGFRPIALGDLPAGIGNATSLLNFGGVSSTVGGVCTSTGGSAVLNCTNVADFQAGQGLRLNHAGAAFTETAPTGATATPCTNAPAGANCTPGSTTYTYSVACLDSHGGVGAAIGNFATSSGPASLNQYQFNYLTWTPTFDCPGYAVYGRTAGSLALIGATSNNIFTDYGAGANQPVMGEDWLPFAPQSVALNDWLIAKINSISGSSVTLATAASSSVTVAVAYHDNGLAIQAALNAATTVTVPCGTFQLSAEPVNFNAGNRLTGAGPCSDLSFITGLPNGKGPIFLANNTNLDNLAILANDGLSPQIGGSIVEAVNVNFVVIDRINLTGFNNLGVELFNVSNSSITNSVFELESPRPTPNQCINVSTSTASQYDNFSGNLCENTGIFAFTANSIYSHNFVTGWQFGAGIAVGPGPGTTTQSNLITDNVITSGGGNPGDVNAVQGNCIEDWSPWSVVSGNYGFGCTGNGIADGGGSNSSITGNVMLDNGAAHIAGQRNGILVEYVSSAYNMNPNSSIISGNALFDTGTGNQLFGIDAVGGSALQLCEQGNTGSGLSANVNNPSGAVLNANCF